MPRSWAAATKRRQSFERAIARVHDTIVGDVVSAVPERRVVERQEPRARHAQPLEVAELLSQPVEVANAVAVPVVEGADVQR